jgi:hypothetical protein
MSDSCEQVSGLNQYCGIEHSDLSGCYVFLILWGQHEEHFLA